MIKFKTYLFSAMALGTLASGVISTEALADHKDGRGRGYGKQVVDVYVDAGNNTKLEKIIGKTLTRNNRFVNIVYSPRYADVTVRVNGHLSRPEIYDRKGRGKGRGFRSGFATMDYNYKIRVMAGGRQIYSDRIRGEVRQSLGRSSGYHRGSSKIEKAERALDLFGVFLETVNGNGAAYMPAARRGHSRYNRGDLEHALKLEAFQEVAAWVGHIKIPNKVNRKRY